MKIKTLASAIVILGVTAGFVNATGDLSGSLASGNHTAALSNQTISTFQDETGSGDYIGDGSGNNVSGQGVNGIQNNYNGDAFEGNTIGNVHTQPAHTTHTQKIETNQVGTCSII